MGAVWNHQLRRGAALRCRSAANTILMPTARGYAHLLT